MKVCEYCKREYVPNTTRPSRIKAQRFCSAACGTHQRYANRERPQMPERRSKLVPIPIGLFAEDAHRLERQRGYGRDYYWRNREKALARCRSEHRKAQRQAWRDANREKVRDSNRKWRHKNAARVRANDRLRQRDAEKRKRYMLKWAYGVTWEWYQQTLAAQGHACAICREPLGEKPRVDHSHETGAVRGVLCNGCNTGLGMMRESPVVLAAAIEYLRRHAECRAAS